MSQVLELFGKNFSAFLSLFYLTPFTLKTNNAAANNLLLAANSALGDKWTDDYNLNSEDLQNGKANFSDMYLNDRAQMLSWMLNVNKEDIANDNPLGYQSGTQGLHFEDKTSGVVVDINKLLNNKQNYIFFADAIYALTGADKNDHLYGSAGNSPLVMMQFLFNRLAHYISQSQALCILLQSFIHHGLVAAARQFSARSKSIQYGIIYPHGNTRFTYSLSLQLSQMWHIFNAFSVAKIILLAHKLSPHVWWHSVPKLNELLHLEMYNKSITNVLFGLGLTILTFARLAHLGHQSPKHRGQTIPLPLHQNQQHAFLDCLPLFLGQIQFPFNDCMYKNAHCQYVYEEENEVANDSFYREVA